MDGNFCLLDYTYVSYSLLDKCARTVFFSSMTRCAEEEEDGEEKNVKISEREWPGLSLCVKSAGINSHSRTFCILNSRHKLKPREELL